MAQRNPDSLPARTILCLSSTRHNCCLERNPEIRDRRSRCVLALDVVATQAQFNASAYKERVCAAVSALSG
jgi:hypothetical protein